MGLIPFTTEEKIKELQRELDMRRRVYPGGNGRITPAKQRQIEILEEILSDYQHGEKR